MINPCASSRTAAGAGDGSEVLQVLLDPPQSVGAPPQLLHLLLVQSHVDHAGDATAVQHAGQREEDLLADTVHVLQRYVTIKID